MGGGNAASEHGDPEVTLGFEYFPRGEETALRLLASRAGIGLAFKLHCFEVGPFHEGRAEKRADGSVVFTYTSGPMTCVTTFTPAPGGRVVMDLEVTGPREELEAIRFIDGCLQHWESPAFRRRGSLAEFAERCFIYTMRGPVSLLDTARGKQSSFPADSFWNNPSCTQWYVEPTTPHPGDIWSFGTCGDRPLFGLLGVVSRDGAWLTAMGRRYNRSLGQGWHDCLHCGGHTRWYLDEPSGRIRQRTLLYVVPNDKEALLRAYLSDFAPDERPGAEPPDDQGLGTPRPGSRMGIPLAIQEARDVLRVQPQIPGAPALTLGVSAAGGAEPQGGWERTYWGTFARGGSRWRMWAHPVGNAVELCVSAASAAEIPVVQAELCGEEWRKVQTVEGVPARVLRSTDGAWSAALFWEQSIAGDPSCGIGEPQEPGASTASARGRLLVCRGEVAELSRQWVWAQADWGNAKPYRMPAPGVDSAPADGWVTFAPNRKVGPERLTYGLTILPPWGDAGYLHVNFPEHLEYDDEDPARGYVGYSLLRHWDDREYPWQIGPDGRSASLDVESSHEPGVLVSARLTAQGKWAVIWMRITNNSRRRLPRVKPLLCFQYGTLDGFPQSLDDNFRYTLVMMGGRLVRLADLPTARPDPQAMVAYVAGCGQHDCDKFANSRGGLVAESIDAGLAAVTAKDGRRSLLVTFTPPKSMLSNAFIPCLHADPYFGDLEPGESAEATGAVVFAEGDLEPAVGEALGLPWLRGAR